ncbi:MAG: hypothetical protein GY946_11705 [bacterium]|nr:hypothetical protein [bacterium]
MGRLLAFLLGGACLALYTPHVFLGGQTLLDYEQWWRDLLGKLGPNWYDTVFKNGPGVFAGLALILIAIRGKD